MNAPDLRYTYIACLIYFMLSKATTRKQFAHPWICNDCVRDEEVTFSLNDLYPILSRESQRGIDIGSETWP